MSVSDLSTEMKNPMQKSVIKMNFTRTVRELRDIAKSRGMTGYHRLHKADLVSLLDTPQRPPRSTRSKKVVNPVTIVPTPEAMDLFEKQEMSKNRPVVKSKRQGWYEWLIKAVPKPIKRRVKDAYKGFTCKIMALYNKASSIVAKPTLHDEVEEEVEEDYLDGIHDLFEESDTHWVQKDEPDLTP